MVAHNDGVDTPNTARLGHGPGVSLFDRYTHSS